MSPRITLAALCLLSLASCKGETPSPQPQPGKLAATPSRADQTRDEPSGKPDAVPEVETEPAPRVDEFLAGLQELRGQLRRASLVPGVALPDDIPLYRIEFSLDADFMTYSGRMDLWVKNQSAVPWTELHFHQYPNVKAIAGDLKCLKITAAEVALAPVQGRDNGAHYVLPLPAPLAPGASVHARLEFAGTVKRYPPPSEDPLAALVQMLSDLLAGEEGDYGVFAHSSGIATLSLWHPILAAFDEDGWDTAHAGDVGDFSYFPVADFLVTLNVDDSFELASTGILARAEPGKREIAAAGVREVALATGPGLLVVNRKACDGRVVINSFALAGELDTQKQVLQTAADALETYEKLFGPYPYPELDLAAVDLVGGIGGVEFPGFILVARLLYTDAMLRLVPEAAAVLRSRFMTETVDFVVAHEVAHQWWNAVVGSHSRKHPFVDEALANYSAILFMEDRHGPEAARRQTLFELSLPFQLTRFLGGADMPVDRPTSEFTDMVEYSGIVYGKGALFLARVREAVSREQFLTALAAYYRAFMFRIAQPEDLVSHLAAPGGKEAEVRGLATRWLHETHGDEDVGLLDPGKLVPVLLRELGLESETWLTALLSEPGLWESVKLLANIMAGDENWERGVDMDRITEWATRLARQLMMDLLFGT